MGISDRDWDQRTTRTFQTSDLALKVLIGLNVLIFLIGLFISQEFVYHYFSFSFFTFFDLHEWWRILTAQFTHANTGHLLFNMIAFWVFGRPLNILLGNKKFTIAYLLCGISGAILSSLLILSGIILSDVPREIAVQVRMVGASGGIYGCIAACAILFPSLRLRLLIPPIEMSMRTFSLVVLGIAVVFILFDWRNSGGEAAHLGGAIFGALLAIYYRWKTAQIKGPMREPRYTPANRNKTIRNFFVQKELIDIDQILDKINQSGIESLTQNELRILREHGKKSSED